MHFLERKGNDLQHEGNYFCIFSLTVQPNCVLSLSLDAFFCTIAYQPACSLEGCIYSLCSCTFVQHII